MASAVDVTDNNGFLRSIDLRGGHLYLSIDMFIDVDRRTEVEVSILACTSYALPQFLLLTDRPTAGPNTANIKDLPHGKRRIP